MIDTRQSLAQDIPALGFQELSLDDPLPRLFADSAEETLRMYGARASGLWELADRPRQIVRDFLAGAAWQGEQANFRGDPEAIGAEMRRWIDEGGLDGFQFIQGADFSGLCETIVPVVRRARRQNDDRADGALRNPVL